ncbi:hypothetical protein E3U43_008054 [Larimichthys crocea]|uniref:Uncharacterized protein n=1 Tax=Larimichthys crocea TaxID=215358 RepID=A0ACD3RVX4_LARCR|nr:hypothetical protein E3U43_008054 [Larimichthys crocea]
MPKLRTFRLHSNNLQCDCHVAWLSEWLRQRPRLGLYTQCMAPPHLRGHNVAEVQKKEFVCTGHQSSSSSSCSVLQCPESCTCSNNIVDCRGKGLTEIPTNLPETITEIRLEQNAIKVIPAGAFSPYKKLRRIDLSNNQISELASDAFQGLRSLNSLRREDVTPGRIIQVEAWQREGQDCEGKNRCKSQTDRCAGGGTNYLTRCESKLASYDVSRTVIQ